MSATLFIRYRCADYDTWRAGYDGFRTWQDEHGVIARGLHRSPEDGNEMMVVHHFASLEAAKAFRASDQLKANMVSIGVLEPVRMEVFEDV